MKTILALVTASVARLVSANVDLIVPRQIHIEASVGLLGAECPSCCTSTIIHSTIKETFYSTVTDTVYTTATEHDVSTVVQHTTDYVTKTSVSTFTTSYPVTVTKLVNCTKKPPAPTVTSLTKRTDHDQPPECDTVTTTEWRTETSTKTVLVPTLVPTTVTDIETVTKTQTQSVTKWVPTTYTATVTRTSVYPITVTSAHDVTVTSTATKTETIVTTVTTSYPVVTQITVTKVPPTATVTLPGSKTTVTVCPVPSGSQAPLDPKSDLTFGCRPGTVCSPHKPAGCDMFRGPPPDDYLCAPDECIPAPPFTPTHWADNQTGYYPPSDAYFYLDPTEFGLGFDIFASVHLDVKRRGLLSGLLPGLCYDECNNAYVVAEAEGKTDALCRAGSAFRVGLDACTRCLQIHAGLDVGGLHVSASLVLGGYVGSAFEQFVNFCGGSSSQPTKTTRPGAPSPSTPAGPDPDMSSRPLRTTTQVGASSPGFESPTSGVAGEPGTPTPSGSPSGPPKQSPPPSAKGSSESAGKTGGSGSSITAGDKTTGNGAGSPTSGSGSHSPSESGSATASGNGHSAAGSGASPTTVPGATPPVVVNGAARRLDLGGTAHAMVAAMVVFILL